MAPRGSPPPPAELLAGLYESVPEGIYVGALEAAGVETLGANPHLKLMFGFDPDEPDDGVRPFAAERFLDDRARADFIARLRRDGAVSNYLVRLRRVDGSSMWVEVTAALRAAQDSRPPRLDALVRDVSERRKLEAQGRDPGHELVQSEKMAALGQTISGVAHELNNPLATILTCAERLAARPVEAETKRGVETILGEAERAAKIVRNLLTFARKRNTTRAFVDMNEIVHDTLAGARLRAAGVEHLDPRRPRRRAAAHLLRPPSGEAGAAEPDHQRRAGDARRQRPRVARRPKLVRRGPGHGHAGDQRRRAGDSRGCPEPESSIPSSPPRRSARAPGSG